MKAIVLTYDKYHPIADHMMHCYGELCPGHPFIFRVPYQEYPKKLKEKYGNKIELIKTPSDIVSTMEKLLEDIADNEWIYWCMDDRYPVELDAKSLNEIYKWVDNITNERISNINFSYKQSDWNKKNIMKRKFSLTDPNGRRYFRIKNFRNIWLHQFIRAKSLKYLFTNIPRDIRNAKEMDYYKDKLILPDSFERFVCSKRIVSFGESTNRGKVTLNCKYSMEKYGIDLPVKFEILNKEIFYGMGKHEKHPLYYIIRNKYHDIKDLF